MKDLLIINPVYKELIWGGKKLRTFFGFDIPSDKTGECWAISGHKNGDCTILNGIYQGKTLSSVFFSNRNLFNNSSSLDFPLLIKIIDSNKETSVQVHPNDSLAIKSNDLGKTECWYILDAAIDSYIIFGHNALSKSQFEMMINENRWNDLLIKKRVKKGDFIYVPAGTLHAMGAGILVLETQTSSNITYRLYDYDRVDENGLKRTLHLNDAIEACIIPHKEPILDNLVENYQNATIKTFISNNFFTVRKIDISGDFNLAVDTYLLVTILEGTGKILNYSLKKGMSFIIPSTFDNILISGNLTLMISSV
ncbi:class I mannose-6-phosphate isomerase [Acholeplasma sp. OttesenSCG-928-E16]|nr:class I mannose-6-phosphate isomerase [Acholeplasma sp. OttesenSCG-928-E16]